MSTYLAQAQKVWSFATTSFKNIGMTLFGVVIFVSPVGFNNPSATPEQHLFWQAMGITIAGSGLVNIVNHWWRIDNNTEIKQRLSMIEAQQTEILGQLKALSGEVGDPVNQQLVKPVKSHRLDGSKREKQSNARKPLNGKKRR